MKNKKPFIIGLLVVIFIAVIAIAVFLIKKYTPSKEHMSLEKYFAVESGSAKVIMNDEICDAAAIIEKDQVYLDYNFIKERLNGRFYWDANEKQMLYTTPNSIISVELDSQDVYTNNSKAGKEYIVCKTDGNTIYLALDYVKEYTALDYKKYDSPDRVVIQNIYDTDISYFKTKKESALRVKPNIKSDILVDLKEGEQLRAINFEKEQDSAGDFVQVMSESGVIGYVQTNRLGSSYTDKNTTDFKAETYSHILLDEQVVLGWHQVTNQAANGTLSKVLEDSKGINVVAPTWMQTSDNEGNISSLASMSYVQTAHRAGVQVWALCDDFAADMKIGNVLSVTSKRQKLARNLIAEAIRYSLDGINIDFENVRSENGEDFVQFIRELGIMCRNNGIILSIDNYPLMDFNAYYNRGEQAAVADYIITMAYDEYYSGSETAGPVSSISYVKNSISALEGIVPAEQHIVALPFYSRLWKETTKNGKTKLGKPEAYSMSGAQEILNDSGAEAKWDEETAMNYLEYKKNKSIYKMWIEDEKSLEEKMKVVAEAKTGGMAFWKLGLEKATIWAKIKQYSGNK